MEGKLEAVAVPVTDMDRAKRFYSEQVGFTVDHDTRVGDALHVVQLTPPGSACSINLTAVRPPGAAPGTPPERVRGLHLVVSDVEAARAELAGRGVDVSAVRHMAGGVWADGRGGRWNSFVLFSDPDGNEWLLQERPADG